jgi:hypothetical protein
VILAGHAGKPLVCDAGRMYVFAMINSMNIGNWWWAR